METLNGRTSDTTAIEAQSHYETVLVAGVALTLCGVAFQKSLGGAVAYALVVGGAVLAAGAALATSGERDAGSTTLRL
jgi:hypothetical protein